MLNLKFWIVLFGIFVGGLGMAHQMHQDVDEARFAAGSFNQTAFLPNSESIRVVSMGYHGMVADLMWVRSILTFTDLMDGEAEESLWLYAMFEAISKLDPGWRTVYYYGGGMLRFFGDIEKSDAIFLLGMEALPLEPYFPFSVGMNAYLFHKDADRAAKYMNIASAIPGAPPWYGAAAASFMSEGGQRYSAIQYLKSQIEDSSEPAVRQALTKKMLVLIHEDYVERINDMRKAFRLENEREIVSVDELGELPPDPYQRGWIISPDGEIRSVKVDQDIAASAINDGRILLTTSFDKWRR